jgi:hypothetical protein
MPSRCGDQQHAAADPCHRAGLPHEANQCAQPWRLDGRAREYFGLAKYAMDQRHQDRDGA